MMWLDVNDADQLTFIMGGAKWSLDSQWQMLMFSVYICELCNVGFAMSLQNTL